MSVRTPSRAARALTARQRRALLTAEADLARDLHALWQHSIAGPLGPLVTRLLADYDAELTAVRESAADDDPHARIAPLWVETHITPLVTHLRSAADTYATSAAQHITDAQAAALRRGMDDAAALIRATLGPHPSGFVPNILSGNPRAVLDLLGYSAHHRHTPLSALLDRIGPDAAARLRKLLLAGLSSGSHPRVVARWIDAILGMPRNRALVIARTELMGAYRRASSATYRANADVLDGWRWLATDDGRTCAFCLSMNGTHHPLDEDMATHPQCRCVQQPATKSWQSILGDLGIDLSGVAETSIG